jgi:hypothetical protein
MGYVTESETRCSGCGRVIRKKELQYDSPKGRLCKECYEKQAPDQAPFDYSIMYEDARWQICYLAIRNFVPDLKELGRKLADAEENGDQVFAIVPNVGHTYTGAILGGFSGITGFAVIVKKSATKQGKGKA